MASAFLGAALALVLIFVVTVKTSTPPVPAASVRGFFLAFPLPAAFVCIVLAFAALI